MSRPELAAAAFPLLSRLTDTLCPAGWAPPGFGVETSPGRAARALPPALPQLQRPAGQCAGVHKWPRRGATGLKYFFFLNRKLWFISPPCLVYDGEGDFSEPRGFFPL